MSRDPVADRLIAEMDARNIDYRGQRQRLISHFKARNHLAIARKFAANYRVALLKKVLDT